MSGHGYHACTCGDVFYTVTSLETHLWLKGLMPDGREHGYDSNT